MTFGQIIFWVGIAVIFALPAIIALVISQFDQGTANMIFGWYNGIVGDLRLNNNTRSIALFVLAILITISAFIGGFGKPLLDDSVNSVVTSVKNLEPKKLPMPKEGGLLWGVLTRDGEIKITPPSQTEKNADTEVTQASVVSKSRKYASWWWWLAVPISWLVAIIYLPISRMDEVFEMIDDLWNRYSTAKAESIIPGDQQSASVDGGASMVAKATTAITGVAGAAGGYKLWKDVFGNWVYDKLKSLYSKKWF